MRQWMISNCYTETVRETDGAEVNLRTRKWSETDRDPLHRGERGNLMSSSDSVSEIVRRIGEKDSLGKNAPVYWDKKLAASIKRIRKKSKLNFMTDFRNVIQKSLNDQKVAQVKFCVLKGKTKATQTKKNKAFETTLQMWMLHFIGQKMITSTNSRL